MILILSQDMFEITTEEVGRWIHALGHDYVRLNGEDLTSPQPFTLRLGARGEDVAFVVDGRRFRAADVGAVWFRRWHTLRAFDRLETADDPRFGREMRDHLVGEVRAVTRGLQVALRHAGWLTRPHELAINKLEVLSRATEAGLDIPPTMITNSKQRLLAFRRLHGGRIIVKPAGQATQFVLGDTRFMMYTSEVTDEDLALAPESFFPTQAQALVEKTFEIRTFFLGGRSWSMATFSQSDQQTAVDFRRYNQEKPNRSVPYQLPAEIRDKVHALMTSLDMTTGSIDLIRTPDGRHVFLEVNPAGQLGMVSHPCNYRLERHLAEHLIALEQRHGRQDQAADRSVA